MKRGALGAQTKPIGVGFDLALQVIHVIFASTTPATQFYEVEEVAWTWLFVGTVLM